MDRAAADTAPRTSGRAFGLQLEADFAVIGLPPEPGAPRAERRVTLELVPPEELDEHAARAALRRLVERDWGTVDGDAGAGYLVRAEGFGAHWLDAGGDRIRSAPPPGDEAWHWQALLTGQLLPLAAVLQGLEVLHASAVVRGDRALAIAGGPGAGKTTLAAELVRRGATLLTDDVLALEPRGEVVLAHPGIGLMSLHRSRAGSPARDELGTLVGEDAELARVAVHRHPDPVELGWVCLVRRDAAADDLRIEHPGALEPRLLLGATFNFLMRNPERMTHQLDAVARMARSAQVLQVVVPPAIDARVLATRLEEALR